MAGSSCWAAVRPARKSRRGSNGPSATLPSINERYTDGMRSVADELRAESRRQLAALTPAARIDLALALGDADLDLLLASRGLARQDAAALISRTRRNRRRLSVVNEPDIA